MENDKDWQTLLRHYEAAVGSFENVSGALDQALARHPTDAEFFELIAAEERARERVLLVRKRMIKHWRASLGETTPLRILNPDHSCDRNGPAEKVTDETGETRVTGIYPTCSVCGLPQLSAADPRK